MLFLLLSYRESRRENKHLYWKNVSIGKLLFLNNPIYSTQGNMVICPMWGMGGDCYIAGLIRYDDCRFSGYMHDKCLTPCD